MTAQEVNAIVSTIKNFSDPEAAKPYAYEDNGIVMITSDDNADGPWKLSDAMRDANGDLREWLRTFAGDPQ